MASGSLESKSKMPVRYQFNMLTTVKMQDTAFSSEMCNYVRTLLVNIASDPRIYIMFIGSNLSDNTN